MRDQKIKSSAIGNVEVFQPEAETMICFPSNERAVFIASPEYSASVTPLLKNALDWISRVREKGDPTYAAFKNRVFAIASASPGSTGGLRSLMALRQILELGWGLHGEQRLSHFLVWQSVYSELVFADELWPDFSREACERCLEEFATRNRRFGGR